MNSEKLNKYLLERRKELLKELDSIDVLINATNTVDVYSHLLELYLSNNDSPINKCSKAFSSKLSLLPELNDDNRLRFSCINNNLKFYGGGKMIPIVDKANDSTWKMYLIDVIESLNGSAKTNEIADVMINSVKELSFIKARQIAADLLPELVKEGKLDVERANSKKEGHRYSVKNFDYKIDDYKSKVEMYIKQFSTQKDAKL